MGWAAAPGYGVESTIGGGDGKVVVARKIEELADYARRSEPLTILVEGTLSGSSVRIASNKTISGVGDDATVVGAELSMNGVSNIIIRNLTIRKGRDGISARKTHHVWIDHCDLSDCGDGLIDITRESDMYTITWCRFSNHRKTMLLNGGSTHTSDKGRLNGTVHHCWFDGSNTRNPRAGFGKIHVFNCLYNGNGYGIGLHSQCLVRAERNFFDKVNNPIKQMYRPDPADPAHGFCESVENTFKACSGAQDDEGKSFPVNDYYLYDFALDNAVDVPQIVKAKAGPGEEFGKLGPLPVPGNGAVNVSIKPVLRWTKGHEAKSYKVAFSRTNPPSQTIETKEQTFDPGTLKDHTVYYWRVDQVTDSGVVKGDVWRFQTEKRGASTD
jgi:pectate lyase